MEKGVPVQAPSRGEGKSYTFPKQTSTGRGTEAGQHRPTLRPQPGITATIDTGGSHPRSSHNGPWKGDIPAGSHRQASAAPDPKREIKGPPA